MSMQMYVTFQLKRNKCFIGDIFSIHILWTCWSDLAQPGILPQANGIQICCTTYSFEVRKKDTLTEIIFPHTEDEGDLWLFCILMQYLATTYLYKNLVAWGQSKVVHTELSPCRYVSQCKISSWFWCFKISF